MLKVLLYAYESAGICAKLTAETCIQFDSPDSENYRVGTPLCWDDTILSQIDIDRFNIYHICYNAMKRGLYNRVTDWKSVWRLNGIPKGEYTDAYHVDDKKIYIGVHKGCGEDYFRSGISAVMILIPLESQISAKEIGEMFKDSSCDFSMESISAVLTKISKQVSGSISLSYSYTNIISLNLFCCNLGSIITETDICAWPIFDPPLVFRKGLMPV